MRGNLPDRWLRGLSLLVVSAGLGLGGCSTTPVQTGPDNNRLTESSRQSNSVLMQQIGRQLDDGEFGNAALQLQLLHERALTPQEQVEFMLLSAQMHLGSNEPEMASEYLSQLAQRMDYATPEQELRASLLKARWYESKGEYLAAARERDFLSAALTAEQREQNHEQIWQDLMAMPELELLEWAEKTPATQLGDWLRLAAISRNSRLTLDEHLAAVNIWREQHPAHPAAIQLPGGLALLADLAANRPTNVALLLPLSGPLEKTGGAIRDGFMAAYYESLNKGYAIPQVQLYDSQQYGDIDVAYAQAQLDGAQWVVGPIHKMQVQALQQRETLPLPTLALNYGDRAEAETLPANLFQYGLAAEDEAVQIAEKAWSDGLRRALVLVPEGNWGERIYAAFEQRWLELGGEIGEQRFYPNRQDYNPEIKALLNVDDSQKRYQTIRRLLNQPTEFEPRRRQDVDWVFMVALPQQARQIKPTLAFNFAGDLPVYATSHVYSGEPNPTKDRDLNGVQFCDIPWLLESSELYRTVENVMPNGQGGYARLYAMGVDAFRLLPRLKQLEVFPHSQMFGSTGALALDHERRIHRRTECTQFRSGRPQRLAKR
ncbi:MAG: penicillin-binding protein activator [Saccharospirillaceae bacterium]|nr:penicillin-binding protein activator [Saccharospirillaceae bacterium]